MNYLNQNEKWWDSKVDAGHQWTQPVDRETIKQAKSGNWNIVLTPTKPVPKEWFPPNLKGVSILCLASGGGQQAPVLAAAGAEVVVLDLSSKQLQQDLLVASRENLIIHTVKGNMTDLSEFANESFDLIVHPVSNMYVEDIALVWKEAYRVLRFNGSLLSGFVNPLVYIFDPEKEDRGMLEPRFSIPYSDLTSLPEEILTMYIESGDPLLFGHSLEDQIGGQLRAGFKITDMYEDNYGGRRLLDKYINTFIAMRAVK